MLNNKKIDRLNTEIDARQDDLIALTQDLIRIPTLNPPGENYRLICEYLENRLKPRGFDCELIRAFETPGDSNKYPRWNIVARRNGERKGDCIHFNSHTDVVELGQDWTRDPFGGELEDDKIYGRGSCDMKGGLAASIIASEAFIDTFPDFSGAIEISGTADEETGGFGGVAYLAEKGFFAPTRVQHVIIPEPLGLDCICLGHRGVWWAEIETKGKIAHGSMPFLGDCAVRHMGAVLSYDPEPKVSIDFNHTEHSCIFAPDQTKVVGGRTVRVLAWYDNEWGFSARMADVAATLGRLNH